MTLGTLIPILALAIGLVFSAIAVEDLKDEVLVLKRRLRKLEEAHQIAEENR